MQRNAGLGVRRTRAVGGGLEAPFTLAARRASAMRRLLVLLPVVLGAPADTRDLQSLDDDLSAPFDDNEGYLAPNPPPPPLELGSAALTSTASCVYSSPSGHVFDMSPMRRTDHDFTGTTNGGYAYRFNVCGNTVKLCNQLPAPASKWRGTKCNNLGDPSTQTVALLDAADPAKGLKFTYTQGDICKRQNEGEAEMASRTVTYEVSCSRSADPGELRLIREVSMCEYVIEFESRYACPVGSGSGFGWRWIFTMLFFAALYVGGGSYYNHRTEGKVLGTVEAIPHVEYWKEVPGLVTDGLAYSYTHGKAAYEASYTQGRGAYETIKEKYSGKLPGL